jgi:hypothetical protein
MRTHCRCFGGPEQARLITVTCLYFDVCFILRRLRSKAIDFASSERLKAAPLDNATGPVLFTGFYAIEVVAAPTRPGLLKWIYDCLEDIHPNTSEMPLITRQIG